MGYDVGKGKRAGFGIGAFLVGIYDQESDQFKTVAKIGTGLSDDEWRELKKRSDKISSQNKPALYDVDKIMDVDVWVKPQIVVEIRADEITRSSMHTAGRTLKPSKTGKAQDVDTLGYALRFPRLEKFRSDKTPEDATSVAEVQEMFESRQ
jgi:DNA ligase-1